MVYCGEYVELGKSGIKVPRLAFGCGFRGIYSIDEASYAIEKAIDSGINFIDCANMYKLRSGIHAEEALAKAIKGKRDKVVITSKYGGEGGGASAANVEKQIDLSLKRIGTDYLDIYFLHMPDPFVSYEEIVESLSQLQSEGKIRAYGLCNHSAWEVVRMYEYANQKGLNKVSLVQNSYNLLNRSLENEMIPACAYEKLGIMTYSPIAAGLLSGAFAHGGKAPEKSTWAYEKDYVQYLKKIFPGKMERIVDAVSDIACKYQVSSVSIAVAWIMRNSNISSVIAGADSPEEFEAYIQGASMKLADDDWKELERLSFKMAESFTHPDVEKLLNRV
jgi:aryl-alcohol dehydrogenase-like predicted oxidoreductase